jgi:hypothetical protein
VSWFFSGEHRLRVARQTILFLSELSFPLSVFLGEWTDNKSLRGGGSALKMSR